MDKEHTAGSASPPSARADSDQGQINNINDQEEIETKINSSNDQEQMENTPLHRLNEDNEGHDTEITDEPSKDTGDMEDEYHEGTEGVHKPEATTEQSEEDDASDDDNPSLCQYTAKCNTGSRDYRKVISHIFGRNKKCTTQIPESCWIIYCRKHYQRTRYRTSKAEVKTYFNIQFDNLARQLTRMERWGGVRSWTIALRKKERGMSYLIPCKGHTNAMLINRSSRQRG